MFNKTIIHQTTLPSTLKVDINRAPTDDSVKLLNEMQDKASKNLILSAIIPVNELKVRLTMIRYITYVLCSVNFEINGNSYSFEKKFEDDEIINLRTGSDFRYAETIHAFIVTSIANGITEQIIKDNKINYTISQLLTNKP